MPERKVLLTCTSRLSLEDSHHGAHALGLARGLAHLHDHVAHGELVEQGAGGLHARVGRGAEGGDHAVDAALECLGGLGGLAHLVVPDVQQLVATDAAPGGLGDVARHREGEVGVVDGARQAFVVKEVLLGAGHGVTRQHELLEEGFVGHVGPIGDLGVPRDARHIAWSLANAGTEVHFGVDEKNQHALFGLHDGNALFSRSLKKNKSIGMMFNCAGPSVG